MITLIEALNFRCLRYISQPLGEFHVLVGPNASGKTTFLDVVAFLGDLVSGGLDDALDRRSRNFEDFLFGRNGNSFELVIEARIPEELQRDASCWSQSPSATIRYAVKIGRSAADSSEVEILAETVTLKPENPLVSRIPRQDFPNPRSWFPTNLRQDPDRTCARTVVKKTPDRSTFYYSERNPDMLGGWAPSYRLGPRKSALGNLPDDESQFPVSSWFKQLLSQGVQRFVLDSQRMRLASPPGQIRGFKTDGSNLPWVVERLRSSGSFANGSGHQTSEAFQDWLSHVRTALPDIEDIRTIEREDDRHRYLMLCYSGGLQVPSWMASDGTLRLLALTLPPYLPDFEGIYLIEEPENGIHPRAVEAVFQSLSSAYRAQILLATHSPIVLGLVDPIQLLCFAKDDQGATDIVRGDEHPALADWKQGVELSTLFASGVLG